MVLPETESGMSTPSLFLPLEWVKKQLNYVNNHCDQFLYFHFISDSSLRGHGAPKHSDIWNIEHNRALQNRNLKGLEEE